MGSLRSLHRERERPIKYLSAFYNLRGKHYLGSQQFEDFHYSSFDWHLIANHLNTLDIETERLLPGELNRMAVLFRFYQHIKEEPKFRDPLEDVNGKSQNLSLRTKDQISSCNVPIKRGVFS
jgi:hypothetical protein